MKDQKKKLKINLFFYKIFLFQKKLNKKELF